MRVRTLHYRRRLLYPVAAGAALSSALLLAFANRSLGVSLPFPLATTATLAAMGCFGFPGAVEWAYNRWRRGVDDNIPKLLADVSGSVRSGFNLARAIELAAESDYGPLTEQLKIDRVQLSWGQTFGEAMENQVGRVDSQLAKRTFASLAQAGQAGGNVQDVLDTIQRHTAELHQIEKETRSAMRPYVSTIYIAVGIFLAISVILIDSFFSKIFASQGAAGAAQATTVFAGLGGLNVASLKEAFLEMGLMESVFGGLGAGKLGEGSFAAGFKHVLALAVLNVVVFTTLVG